MRGSLLPTFQHGMARTETNRKEPMHWKCVAQMHGVERARNEGVATVQKRESSLFKLL